VKAHAKTKPKGEQFIGHVKTLPGNPYDGHTLETVIPEIETQIGASLCLPARPDHPGGSV